MKHKLLLIILLFTSLSWSQENCNNGIDDDADGLIDLNDSECVCTATSAIPSILPNPSFEINTGCPTSFSELYLANPWIQATTDATSDYFHTCGFVMPGIAAAGLQNFPDGNGIVGAAFMKDYKEYIGSTLLSPMLAGNSYQFSFYIAGLTITGTGDPNTTNVNVYEPFNLTIYGCNNGANLPLVTNLSPDTVDPTWIEIGSVTYTPVSTWGQISILFTPSVDINAIMFGSPTVLPPSYLNFIEITNDTYPYFLFDGLTLNTAAAFGVNITQTGNFCDVNLVLTANITTTVSSGVTYQWYKNGIAIIGATNSTYSVPVGASNLGNYSVKVTDGSICFISSAVTVNNTVAAPNVTIVQPSCAVVTGSITVTTPSAEYSFDNGVTWQTGSTKNLLPLGTYYIRIKTATGCISAATAVDIIDSQLSFQPNFTSIDPINCMTGGSITITTPSAEYSFDNGVTWTTNPTATNLPSGDYYIKIKDSMGCISAANYVYISPFSGSAPGPNYTTIQPTCSVVTGSITITTPAAEYSFDNGVTWTTNPTATNLPIGDYFIKVKDSVGCISLESYVSIYPFSGINPGPNYTTIQPSCSVSSGTITITTVASEYSFDNGVTWVTSNVKSNLPSGDYLIRVKDTVGCISDISFVTINPSFGTLNDPTFTIVQPFCTIPTGTITITSTATEYSFDNGTTWQTTNVKPNLIPETYSIKVKDINGCVSNTVLAVIIPYIFPAPPTLDLQQKFCQQNNPTLNNITATGQNIKWYSSQIGGILLPVTTPLVFGTTYYASQTLTDGCESLRAGFLVMGSNAATISQIITADWTDNNNTFTVLLSNLSIGDYEFSIDGIVFQDSNVFYGLESGVYTVTIRDKNGCGTVRDDVYLLVYPKFFTPNGDGFNDFWSIKYSRFEQGLKVELFDRYGKFIKELHYNESWDGTYNGLELPSTDYWFLVTRIDGKEHRGHFTLKR